MTTFDWIVLVILLLFIWPAIYLRYRIYQNRIYTFDESFRLSAHIDRLDERMDGVKTDFDDLKRDVDNLR